ncbi:DUF937 domain-containing protein [uncultured Cellulomonas sp.]|uniref:DUF937 domain-containing protein n=1 Tax=uncultured Cellulomonas sp. TaxID=189682 RepID=UPI0028E5707A|nr:DUF937 domain-containing protein [uncultured Cellulomonas sp.]
MAAVDDLTAAIPIDQLAARLGVDTATASSAVAAALPALLGGIQANAQDPAGAASLSRALGTKDPALVAGGVDLDRVDTDDGAKIVRNVFGPNQDQVVAALGSDSRTPDQSIIAKVLPLLAPIVMAFLAKQLAGRSGSSAAEQESGASGGGLGDLLGGVLGGGGSSGGGLGGVLGGMLGGGSSGGSAGGIDIGSILGGLLGGGKR